MEHDRRRGAVLGSVVYAVDVGAGRVRKLDAYSYAPWAGDLTLAGFVHAT